MRRSPWPRWLLPVLVAAALLVWWQARQPVAPITAPAPSGQSRPAADAPPPAQGLPRQALDTIALIHAGGPFPHRQDGSTFGNRENRLPRMPRGYYREYTVETPGLSHRGARRIVTGGRPPDVWYYTDDHYDSFRRIEVQP